MATTITDPATSREFDPPPFVNAGPFDRKPGTVWDPTARLAETSAELRRLGLVPYALELDERGFTIIPPELVGPPGHAERLLEAALDVAETESGVRPDVVTGETHRDVESRRTGRGLFKFQEEFTQLLWKHPAFEEYALNPTLLAMMTYLLGEHCEWGMGSGPGVWFRGPSEAPFPGFIPSSLHSDLYAVPSPFPAYAQVANSQLALTDFTFEGGCIGFVPGSNQLQRHPVHTDELIEQWVPAECPAGSLVIWHGNTWHTIGNPRVIPGLRVSVGTLFCRAYMRPLGIAKGLVTQELLDRNPPRLAMLLGLNSKYNNDLASSEQGAHFRRDLDSVPNGASRWQ